MTLGGMVKHLALVEDDWFQVRFLGRPDPEPWASAPLDDDPDWDWHSADERRPPEIAAPVRGRVRDEPNRRRGGRRGPRQAVDGDRPRTGGRFTLRWIIVHIVEETARHNGHADLLREAIDGSVGE